MARALLWTAVDPARARRLLVAKINEGGLPLMYQIILDGSQADMRRALCVALAALEARRTLLFFCKAGKDRTGLLAALILANAGASDEAILADYERSDAHHAVALAGLERMPELVDLNRAVFERAPREAMASALGHLRERYGGVRSYLDAIGFGRDRQRRLRDALAAADGPPPAAPRL